MIFMYIIFFYSTNTTQVKSSTTLTNSPVPGSSPLCPITMALSAMVTKLINGIHIPAFITTTALYQKQSHKFFSTRKANQTTVLMILFLFFFLHYLCHLLHLIHNRVISIFGKWYQIMVIILWSIESAIGLVKTQIAPLLPPSKGFHSSRCGMGPKNSHF